LTVLSIAAKSYFPEQLGKKALYLAMDRKYRVTASTKKAEMEGGGTMRCNFDRLIAYLNDGLSENQSHNVFVHLQDCEICFEAVVTMMQESCIKDPDRAPAERLGDQLAAY
jgi:hypothetical protein